LAIIYIIDGCPDVQNTITTFLLIVVYFSIEIFRYPYYAASSLELKVNLLTWLRYNAWIPMYPLGLILEGITMYRVLPYYYRTDKYSIELPNPANFAFNFAVALGIFLFFVFPFVAKYLLTHMWIQRQKKYKSDLKKAA
uniref:Very-long-chain (3R)-3-hydroxyacyl-CoA dehydratase n=1 Tax=Gongylonema pulchrum TaxID=637853 RepID=A0A183D8N9_9BILA